METKENKQTTLREYLTEHLEELFFFAYPDDFICKRCEYYEDCKNMEDLETIPHEWCKATLRAILDLKPAAALPRDVLCMIKRDLEG